MSSGCDVSVARLGSLPFAWVLVYGEQSSHPLAAVITALGYGHLCAKTTQGYKGLPACVSFSLTHCADSDDLPLNKA